MTDKLPQFVCSGDLEVQERASAALQLVSAVTSQLSEHSNDPDSAQLIIQSVSVLFTGEMNPVAPKAQKKVQIPEGYVLRDVLIN